MDEYGEGYYLRGEGSNYRGYGADARWPSVAFALASVVPPPALLYEVGCATGWFLVAARKAGYEGYGVDVSAWAVSHVAKEAALWVQLGDAVALPWHRPADLMVSWETLEHVPEPRLPAVFAEMLRCTKPGGVWAHRIGFDASDATHKTIKPRGWWVEQFLALGLTYEKEATDTLLKVGEKSDWAGRSMVWRVPC